MSDGVHDYEKNMATCCGTGVSAKTGELTVLPEQDPKPEGHKPDLSWLVVAVDGAGDGWVMDKADGFDEVDLMPNGNACCDNGVYMPKDLPMGLYRVTDVRVAGGELIQSPNGDDYTEIEISGTWRRTDKDAGHMAEDAVYVLFDGPPGPEAGRFVEVEDQRGRGVGDGAFSWAQVGKHWTLGPFYRQPTTGCNWKGMGSAPHDGETFLLDRGGSHTHAVPCFRYHTKTDAEGGSVEGGGWTVLEGCPDEGGFGCATMFVPDSLVPDEWRWSPMPGAGK